VERFFSVVKGCTSPTQISEHPDIIETRALARYNNNRPDVLELYGMAQVEVQEEAVVVHAEIPQDAVVANVNFYDSEDLVVGID